MKFPSLWLGLTLASTALAGCTAAGTGLPDVLDVTPTPRPQASMDTGHELDGMIARYANAYDVPVSLVHHVVKRESNYNPSAYNAGNYGLMQIRYRTAKGMGYEGSPKGLFDPETNLKYAVKYLKGAYVVAEGNPKEADWLYRKGYYYDAKRKGLLVASGLKDADDYDEKPAAVAALEKSTEEKTSALTLAKKAEDDTGKGWRTVASAVPPQIASAAPAAGESKAAAKGDRLVRSKAGKTPSSVMPQQMASSAPVRSESETVSDDEETTLPGISMAYSGDTPTSGATPPIPSFRPQ